MSEPDGRKANLSPEELRARLGDAESGYNTSPVSLTVDRISRRGAEERLALLKAVHQGELDTQHRARVSIGIKGSSGWCTATVQPWGQDGGVGPLVGASLGAPPARFDRVGRPELDWAAMRFIVAAHENFAFLLDLAEEGLAARKARETMSALESINLGGEEETTT